jgi:hypothetical protein
MQVSATLNPYWLLLRDLSTEEKLSLIELLVKSLQATSPAPKSNKPRHSPANQEWVHRFAGSWNDFPETAEEMIALIQNARTASRPVEML